MSHFVDHRLGVTEPSWPVEAPTPAHFTESVYNLGLGQLIELQSLVENFVLASARDLSPKIEQRRGVVRTWWGNGFIAS